MTICLQNIPPNVSRQSFINTKLFLLVELHTDGYTLIQKALLINFFIIYKNYSKAIQEFSIEFKSFYLKRSND